MISVAVDAEWKSVLVCVYLAGIFFLFIFFLLGCVITPTCHVLYYKFYMCNYSVFRNYLRLQQLMIPLKFISVAYIIITVVIQYKYSEVCCLFCTRAWNILYVI